jgi:hypothetical protein
MKRNPERGDDTYMASSKRALHSPPVPEMHVPAWQDSKECMTARCQCKFQDMHHAARRKLSLRLQYLKATERAMRRPCAGFDVPSL